MTINDIPTIEQWSAKLLQTPENLLRVAFEVFGELDYFFIGEFNGQLIASLVMVPWSETVTTGSFFLFSPSYRQTKSEFASRLYKEAFKITECDGLMTFGDAVMTSAEFKNSIMTKPVPNMFYEFDVFMFRLPIVSLLPRMSNLNWNNCLVSI